MDTRKPFAFISYSRKDVAVATDIRQRLEKYVYSKELVLPENRPEDPRYVRPIFQDLADLHTRKENFWDELKEKVRDARYLIVICSSNSAQSETVKKGISYFLQTHDNDTSRVIPLFIDNIVPMTEVVDEIVKVRNCPIYITKRDKEGHVGRKYCFYHLLEYLLHVDFYKLYNRYEAYKRRKATRKIMIAMSFFALALITTIYGWISSRQLAEKESQRATTAEALTIFERKTFPYSLVVGYVNNFLRPTLDALKEKDGEMAHIIIYMPYSYEQLNIVEHTTELNGVVAGQPTFADFTKEEIAVKAHRGGVTLVRANFKNEICPVYIDQANTVVAFKYVVDYKFNSEENPLKVVNTKENRDRMVQEYTDEFIAHTLKNLDEYRAYIHFVRSKTELNQIISIIMDEK
ncbi:MAG: toll/interleukin-1 receptor domain-containing protein [Bacteroidales bacterium]|nr:toll/interleukin-1 receptor domain-containing protein [Bacteroidales bacterium]